MGLPYAYETVDATGPVVVFAPTEADDPVVGTDTALTGAGTQPVDRRLSYWYIDGSSTAS